MPARAHYERLATLFEYPTRDYPAVVQGAAATLAARYPQAAAALEDFAAALPCGEGGTLADDALDEMQELFTRSFDVQAITTLGVGYVIFGDDYKRGELLVNLHRELAVAAVDCGSELPDHLPLVLRLLAVWDDEATVQEFVEEILHPALGQMIREFGPERMQQRNRLYEKHYKTLIRTSADRGTIFAAPLSAVASVLEADFGLSARERPERHGDFLRSIGRELEIEASEGRPAPMGRML